VFTCANKEEIVMSQERKSAFGDRDFGCAWSIASCRALYVSQKRQQELVRELEARLHSKRSMGHPIRIAGKEGKMRIKSCPRNRIPY
jgi:hypothetical protein